MPRSSLVLPLRHWRDGLSLPESWRQAILRVAFAWAVLGMAFFHDWATIAKLAWTSSTYNHIVLMPLILVWLVAQRTPDLVRIEPVPWWPGLLISAGAGFIWLLGAFSGLDLARQLGVLLLLMSTVPALLGVRVSAGLIFPLAYMLLLVPFGDELIPHLQMITAAITVSLVKLSGVPAVIDGVFIDTPAGLFEVAEACSGVKFLIAMVALGILVANVCFLSWKRRVVFFAACLVVPILANGVRAWATVYAAQIFGVEAAAGFDHIVYGWIFFAVVVFLVIAGAWRFFDRPADDAMIDADAINASAFLARLEKMRIGSIPALAALGLLVMGSQIWAKTASELAADLPDRVFLPDVPGWQRVDYAPGFWWEPRAEGADHRLLGRYSDAQGRIVDVFVSVYAAQGEGREAGGFGQGALRHDLGWSWQSPGPAIADGKSDRLLAPNRVERLAVTWYRSGSLLTGSNTRLKLVNMADRLTLTAHPTTMLILSAEEREGHPAEGSIRAFVKAAGPLDEWMDHVAGLS